MRFRFSAPWAGHTEAGTLPTAASSPRRVPDFFLVGAARSGTTSLIEFLGCHPDIFVPRRKEPKLFSSAENCFPHRGPGDERIDATVVTDPHVYSELFRTADDRQLTGEASVDYLFFPGVASRIREANPAGRIIIVLRNPIERAFSAYSYLRSTGRETLSFEAALAAEPQRKRANWEFFWLYREVGLYSRQIERYFHAFGRRQVCVLLFDDLQRDPVRFGALVLDFLGVAPRTDSPRQTNRSGAPRSPFLLHLLHRPSPISLFARWTTPPSLRRYVISRLTEWNRRPSRIAESTRRELYEYYAEDIQRTQELIERDLGPWLQG